MGNAAVTRRRKTCPARWIATPKRRSNLLAISKLQMPVHELCLFSLGMFAEFALLHRIGIPLRCELRHTKSCNMPTSEQVAPKCFCGRNANRPHCSRCGSVMLYAYTHLGTAIRAGGKPEQIQVYRCRSCGNRFNQDDWQLHCDAPAPREFHRPARDPIQLDTSEQRQEFISHFQDLEVLKKLI